MSPLEPAEIAEYFDEPLDVRELYSEAAVLWDESEGKSNIDRAMEFFTKIYLQDDILTKGDRASMLSSLEVRAVFLDNDLVAFCQRLPSRLKYRNGDRKYLLKQVARRSLPPQYRRPSQKRLWCSYGKMVAGFSGSCSSDAGSRNQSALRETGLARSPRRPR